MHNEQHDHHIHAAQPTGVAEDCCHMNDCADAVDIEEVCDDERDNTLIFDNHAACVFYVAQRV